MRALLPLLVVLVALVAAFGLATEHFLSVATARALASQLPASIILATGVTHRAHRRRDRSLGRFGARVCAARCSARRWWRGSGRLSAAIAVCLAAGLALRDLQRRRHRRAVGALVHRHARDARDRAGRLLSADRFAHALHRRAGRTDCRGRERRRRIAWRSSIAVALVAATDLVLRRTVFGRRIVAVGDNPRAAWAAGVDPRPVRAAAFALSPACSPRLASVLHTSRLASADPNAGSGFELQAIAAVGRRRHQPDGRAGQRRRVAARRADHRRARGRPGATGRAGADETPGHRRRHRRRGGHRRWLAATAATLVVAPEFRNRTVPNRVSTTSSSSAAPTSTTSPSWTTRLVPAKPSRARGLRRTPAARAPIRRLPRPDWARASRWWRGWDATPRASG